MLLNAYGWWKASPLMYIAAITAFVLAGLAAAASALGFWHLRRTPPGEEVFPGLTHREPAHA